MPGQSPSFPDAVVMAVGHVRASSGEDIAPEEFLRALSRGEGPAAGAVDAWLHEADPAELADLVACGATSFEMLARTAARFLPPDHPNRAWLDELAP